MHLKVVPCFSRYLFHCRLQPCESCKIHISKLLLIVLCLALPEIKGMEGCVTRRNAVVGKEGIFTRDAVSTGVLQCEDEDSRWWLQ